MLDLVLLALLFWLVWRKRAAPRRSAPRSGHSSPGLRSVVTVRCQTCGLHLPREEAILAEDGSWYCSREHALEGRNAAH